MSDNQHVCRTILTDSGITYEQRKTGTSTEVRTVAFHPLELGYLPNALHPDWTLLDPEQAEPYVGDRWTLRFAHGRWVRTDIVNEIIGDLA